MRFCIKLYALWEVPLLVLSPREGGRLWSRGYVCAVCCVLYRDDSRSLEKRRQRKKRKGKSDVQIKRGGSQCWGQAVNVVRVSSDLRMVLGITEWRTALLDCAGAGVSLKGASGGCRAAGWLGLSICAA
jgi:hypothetical protein